MKSIWYLNFLAAAALAASGCTSDAVSIDVPDDETLGADSGKDPGTGTDEPGTGTDEPGTGTDEPGTGTDEPGTGTDEPGTGTDEPDEGCTDACSEGESVCAGSSKKVCVKSDNGCTDWQDEACPDGQICHDNPVRCAVGCQEICDNAKLKRCADGGFETCTSDGQGCAVWYGTECGEGYYCDEENPGCTKCAMVCDSADAVRCNGQNIEICSTDANGCGSWTVKTECETGKSCDPKTFECKAGCTNSCTAGAKQCSGNDAQECRDANGDGCTEWVKKETCTGGKKCVSGACMNVCTNQCTSAGAKDCSGSIPRECKDANGDGCLEWVNGTACSANQTCTAGACKDNNPEALKEFSIILLPDTQYYSRALDTSANSIFYKQLKWVVDNKDKNNIKFVMHLGDITDNNDAKQWAVARNAFAQLEKNQIPYTIANGNHDYKNTKNNDASVSGFCSADRGNTKFASYFNDTYTKKAYKNPSDFSGYKYTSNSYALFEGGGQKFLVLALEFSPRKEVLCWADSIIKKYPNHHVIIHTHAYLGLKGYCGGTSGESPDVPYGASPREMFNDLVARHSNVMMVLAGHVGGSWYRESKGYNGNKIIEMLVDYQFDHAKASSGVGASVSNACASGKNSGNGWFRELKFNPKDKTITAVTHTVLKNSEFIGSQPAFYCSEKNTDGKYYYPYNLSALLTTDSALKNSAHNYKINYDFTAPISYKYNTNNIVSFSTQIVNDKSAGDQLVPAVAVHESTGAYVAVWQDNSSDADGKDSKGNTNYDIEARLFYGAGCAKAKQFTVNADTAGNQSNPDVAMDKNGNFVVVWEDDSDGNGTTQIWMRGFKADGSELFSRKTVNSVADGQQYHPEIAMAPDGRFVVTWEDYSNGKTTPQIFIRGFNANGSQLFADRNVESAVAGSRKKPDIAMASDGFFVVAWEDDSDANGFFEVKAKGFTIDGKDKFGSFIVNSESTGQQLNPSVGMNASGDFYIAYEDDRDKNGIYRVWARGYKKDKTAILADKAVSPSGENAHNPVVCVDSTGSGIFGWQADALYNGDIRRAAYNASTKTFSDAVNVNPVTKGAQNNPGLGCSSNGSQVWVWSDDVDGNGIYEIYGRGLSKP